MDKCPPPPHFRPANSPYDVRLEEPPDFARSARGNTPSRARGLRYQRRATGHLLSLYPTKLVPGPWFSFRSPSSPKRSICQPDALILDFRRGLITVVEIKLRHTTDAWWQCVHLYLPVVRAAFGADWGYAAVEMCHYYDGRLVFPEPVRRLRNILDVAAGQFGVHVCNERDCRT